MPDAFDLKDLAAALGPAARVAYAPPNIFPMSAPSFVKSDEWRPHHPAGDRVSIYAHVPFCNYHCNFCFYATQVHSSLESMERYVKALLRELEWLDPGVRLSQLYVGGGTPTALPPELLERLLTGVFARLQGCDEAHTVECSPDSVRDEHIDVLVRHGIERVSMGVQSMTEPVLESVDRRHHPSEAMDACSRLVEAGVMVNIDLIYGLPGQTESDFQRDFQAVASRGIHSVTAYNLRVNEKTRVARLLREDEQLQLERLVRWRAFVLQTASDAGFEQTRWHTFRRREGEGRGQQVAMRFVDLTGRGEQFSVGMSARSRLQDVIYRNHSGLSTYLNHVESGQTPVKETFPLSEEGRITRFLALSIGDGLPLHRSAFEAGFGRSVDEYFEAPLARLTGHGLVEDDGEQISLSATGKLVYDLVLLAFYPQAVREQVQARQSG